MIHDNGQLIENPMEQKVLKRIFELKGKVNTQSYLK